MRTLATVFMFTQLASVGQIDACLAHEDSEGRVEVEVGGRVRARFKTLEDAFDFAREKRKEAEASVIQVKVGSGKFQLHAPLVIDASLGSSGRFILSGSVDAPSIITGSISLPIKKEEGTSNGLGIAEVDLRPLPTSLIAYSSRHNGSDPNEYGGFQVFQAGQRLSPARWPTDSYALGVLKSITSLGDSKTQLIIENSQLPPLANEPYLWVAGFFGWDWYFSSQRAYTRTEATLLTDVRNFSRSPNHKVRFNVFNVRSMVSRRGDFYLDPVGRKLQLIPLIPTVEFIDVPIVSNLLYISDTSGIEIKNIYFEGSIGDSIVVNNSSYVELNQLSISGSGRRGIVISGGNDVYVTGCSVRDVGSAAIYAEAGDRRTLRPGNLSIGYSTIQDFMKLDRAGGGGIVLRGVGNVIHHNHIEKAPHAAIAFSGNDHRIFGNEVNDVNREVNDAGAIYTGRDWTARGTVIFGNYFHDIGMTGPWQTLVGGVYLDDGASGITVERNIFIKVSRGILLHGGRDNYVAGNLFFHGAYPLIWERLASQTSRSSWNKNSVMRQRYYAMPVQSRIWMERYPELSELPSQRFEAMENNKIVENITSFGPTAYDADRKAHRYIPGNSEVEDLGLYHFLKHVGMRQAFFSTFPDPP
ncbi:right-handed parallel beta-helix repeat-containing protein [Rhizobium terrae]|uniref:right-handed parallel beta-helix repeat-containing protein n=1 Tax=Rhizobium terrae TaxID=2171756 RepID=UPI0013C2E732|nr:right-handed parallel beta-helix repeat-containing protein [Rhizobium terrae]